MWSVPWHRHSLRGLFPAQVCSQTLTHPGLRPKHHRHHPETQNKTERRVKQDVKPRPAVTRFTRTSPARRHKHSLMSTASRPPHVTEHSNYNSALMILHICLYHTCDPRTMQWFRLEQRLVCMCVCVDSTSYSMPHSQQHFLLCSLTLTLILWLEQLRAHILSKDIWCADWREPGIDPPFCSVDDLLYVLSYSHPVAVCKCVCVCSVTVC